jgi:16S rRNA G966 N2-methylase RsmD
MKRIVPSKSGKQNQTTHLLIEAVLQLVRNRAHHDQLAFVELFAGSGNISYTIMEHCKQFNQIELQEIDHLRLAFLQKRFSGEPSVSVLKRDSYRIIKKFHPDTVYFADPPYPKTLLRSNQFKLLSAAMLFPWKSGFFMMQAERQFANEASKKLPGIHIFEYSNNCLIIIEKDLSIKA